MDGAKYIVGFWINETKSKHTWMHIFDEIKGRGVGYVLFISMDGVSGLEEWAKSIFKDVVVQRCIICVIGNSMKFAPSKEYKAFKVKLRKNFTQLQV